MQSGLPGYIDRASLVFGDQRLWTRASQLSACHDREYREQPEQLSERLLRVADSAVDGGATFGPLSPYESAGSQTYSITPGGTGRLEDRYRADSSGLRLRIALRRTGGHRGRQHVRQNHRHGGQHRTAVAIRDEGRLLGIPR